MPSQNDFTRNQLVAASSFCFIAVAPLCFICVRLCICVCGWAQKHTTHTSVNLHRYANAA